MSETKAISGKYLLAIQLTQGIAISIAASIFLPYLRSQFSFAEMSMQSLITYATPLVILPFVKRYRIRWMLIAALFVMVVRALHAITLHDAPSLYLNAILGGLPLVLFWVAYELLYFQKHDAAQHAKRSSWYFGVWSVTTVGSPAIAGLIADRFGFTSIFWISAFLMLIPLALVVRLPTVEMTIPFREAWTYLRNVRALIVFDGFFLSSLTVLIALSLLTFTRTATQFGFAISIAAFTAMIASLAVARWSDRSKKRTDWLVPLTIACAGVMIVLGLQKNIVSFTIVLMIFTSLRTIMQPIMNALPMDLCHDHAKLFVGRQFLLNFGRAIGFVLTWLAVLTVGFFPMYVVYAISFLMYLFVIKKTPGVSEELHRG